MDDVGDCGVGSEGVRGKDGEGGVGVTLNPWADDVGIGDGGDIVIVGKALGIEGESPAENIAIVTTPAVNDLYVPSAVHGAAHKGGKRLVRVIEIGAQTNVGGVEGVAMDIDATIDDPVVWCKYEGIHGIGPTVAPTHARPVSGKGRVTSRGFIGSMGESKIGADRCIKASFPTTAGRGYGTIALRVARATIAQDVGRLAIGAGDVDVEVAGVGMLQAEHDVADVVDIGDLGIVVEVGEFELGAVRATIGAAGNSVREEDAVGLGKEILSQVDMDIGEG